MHEGSGCLKVTATSAILDDLLVSGAATITVAANDTVTFWAQLGNTDMSGKFTAALNVGTAGLKTGATTAVNITASDTAWHLYSVDVNAADAGDMYLGLFATGAASGDVYIDDVQVNNVSLWNSTKSWTPYASKIILTLSLASGGQSIDFSPGTDTDSDGVYTTDDAAKTNKMVINYNDNYAHFTDVAWTGEFVGNNNGDYMLDPGEKVQLTVDLGAVNSASGGSNKVDANHQFTLECKTPKGAILSFQRTMPARLYGIDNLY